MTNHITFNTTWDIVADQCGLYSVPSGTTPHHPDETRLIYRNADFQFQLDEEDATLVRRAAAEGDIRKLHQLVDRLLTPVGRAAESGWI